MPTIIQPLSASALDYLAAFDLRFCVSSSGRVYTTKNPQVGARLPRGGAAPLTPTRSLTRR
jgi:hypothetical protein